VRLLLFILMLAIATGLPAAKPSHAQKCALSQPVACDTVNPLVWQPEFKRTIRRMLAAQTGVFVADEPVWQQQLDVLGGPPDDRETVDGYYLFAACRSHSCPEKGAAVIAPDGTIAATAILYSPCAGPNATAQCTSLHNIVIFMTDLRHANETVTALKSWANRKLTEDYARWHPDAAPPPGLDTIDIRTTKSRLAKRQRPA